MNDMGILNEFLKKTRKQRDYDEFVSMDLRPRIICLDGYSLSVQASRSHYCHPREDYGPYSEVEVGYPSTRPPKEWRRYFDGEWQSPGILGTLTRFWKDRSSIWYAVKERCKGRTWPLRHWRNTADNATQSVYAYVPIEMVVDLIQTHGGLDWNKTFPKEVSRE